MNQRKAVLGRTAQYLHNRIAEGKPLPPTMRRGSPEYVKCSYWQTLNQRCANGANRVNSRRNEAYAKKGVNLELTKEQFNEWVDKNWETFRALYESGRTPSIDRIDNSRGYAIDNMQVIDLKQNMRKDRIKPVISTCLFTGREERYESAVDAERDGFDKKLISRACAKGMNHKGRRWRFE